jgi:DNA-binding CsgD family transcriptional regulator
MSKENSSKWRPDAECPPIGLDKKGAAPSSEHLVHLEDQRWALWRCVGLRGAGFPAIQVLDLSASKCAARADQFLEAEAEVTGVLSEALEAVNQALDKVKAGVNGNRENESRVLYKAKRRLKKGKIPPATELPSGIASKIHALEASSARLDQSRAEYSQAFAQAKACVSDAICKIINTNDFREAVIWQNHQAYHTGVAALLCPSGTSGAAATKQRQHEEMVASYLQRYCLKNDTIGFFGPVGWARISQAGEAVVERPGPTLLAARNVYFEVWGIDALAGMLSRDKTIRPWIVPRPMPFIHVEGTTLLGSIQGTLNLSPEQVAVFRACDGERTAREIAADLARSPSTSLKDENRVYSILGLLRYRGLIVWAFEVPMEMYPERILRRMIERVEDERLRTRALAALEELESARRDIVQAAGNAERLDQAMDALEVTFTRLTGLNFTRSEGRTYAARTLVYEDCRRDLELVIGPDILQALGPPLSLLLTSARWFTHRAASIYREAFAHEFAKLKCKSGPPVICFMDFWSRVRPLFHSDNNCLMPKVVRDFQQLWSDILDVSPEQTRLDYTVEGLRPRVQAAFDTLQTGWKSARYHSPDIMIAAPSTEAIRNGQYQLVLGELHIAANTLSWQLFIQQHPSPTELFQSLELDFPEPRLISVVAKPQRLQSARLVPGLISPKDFRLVLAAEPYSFPKSQAVLVGELVVEEAAGELEVRTRDGRLHWSLIEALGDLFMSVVISRFKILGPRSHAPRVSFDRLVVCRESWYFSPSDITFASEKNDAARFVAARRWAAENGMPRFVFVKTSSEVKPFYVDFDSPIYITLLAKSIRRAAQAGSASRSIAVTEMLPAPDQAWLPDILNQRYTSELRMVAVDLKP